MTASVSGSKGKGHSLGSNEICKDIVPYDAEKAARSAAGITSDDEGSRTIFDVSDSDDVGSDSGSALVIDTSKSPSKDLRSIFSEKSDIDRESSHSTEDSEDNEVVVDTQSSQEEDGSETSSESSGEVISFASEPPKPTPVRHITPKKQPATSSSSSNTNTPIRLSPAEKPHSTTASTSNAVSRKRKSLSPPVRETGSKQARLNKTINVMIDHQDLDSGDDRKVSKGKRGRQYLPPGPASSKLADPETLRALIADQAKYPPQHESGRCQEFKADEKRIKYFNEAMDLKVNKYWNMNSVYWRDNSRVLHLAMPFLHFVEHYWPGQVLCCGRLRENAQQLERHIQRMHKPPKHPPTLAVVPLIVQDASDSAEDADLQVLDQKEPTGAKSTGPPGFMEDQNKFPPQQNPGEPEDFLANQDSIDYFIDAFRLKREKYSNMMRIEDKPLSGSYSDFVLHYWPGMMSCCGKVQLCIKDFQKHLTACHLPPQKISELVVTDMAAVELAKASRPISPAVTASRSDTSPLLASPRSSTRRTHLGVDAVPGPSHRDVTPVQHQTGRDLISTPSSSMSFMDEARKLRARASQSTSVVDLLPVLERILDMSSSVTLKMRSLIGICPSSGDQETRANTVECLEYVWNASKSAIIKWEDLKGRTVRDACLMAVQYAFSSLPVFVNWEETKYLDMVESVILLCKGAVKQWAPNNPGQSDGSTATAMAYGLNPSATAAAVASARSKRRSVVSQSTPKAALVVKREPSPCSPAGSPGDAKLKNLDALVELCRLANVAVWQNTKSRPDFKDDAGNYHTMYRYGFKKMLDLYFPSEVSQLMCCGKAFDRPSLVTHVSENHETGCCKERTEPSISLP